MLRAAIAWVAGMVREPRLLGSRIRQSKVFLKAEQQLDEEIGASRNHAAIILWSMANETPRPMPARISLKLLPPMPGA